MAKRKKKQAETGYKKRLARRASGNPGARQMWVPAYVIGRDGIARPHPEAVRRITPEEARRLRAEDEAAQQEAAEEALRAAQGAA